MLLTNRRHRILFITLAAMEVAWFLPFAMTAFIRMQADFVQLPALLYYSGEWAPIVLFAICWGALLLYLLSADLLNQRQLEFPQRDLIMLGIVLGTFLLSIRLLIFPTLPLWNLAWLGTALRAIYDQGPGSAAILFLLGINLFLWIRVATATGRSLTFFGVGVSFRLGMLLALLGNSLLLGIARQPVQQALLYLWLFFGFGLLAVALARTDEKAFRATQSSGTTLPWGRLVQLIAMTTSVILVAIGAGLIYTPPAVRAVIGWFSPLWNLLGAILLYLFSVIFILLGPLLERLAEAVRALMANLEPLPVTEGEFGPLDPATEAISIGEIVQNVALIRYCLVTLVLFGILFLIWLLFARTRLREVATEREATDAEGFALGGNPFNRLRNLADLLRRYGLRPGLLAAISVQNLYANVCRLAARRGYPRPAAQPPDEYLSQLRAAFPGQDVALLRLTNAYMRVHYGDHPADEPELAQLRSDYTAIQATPKSS